MTANNKREEKAPPPPPRCPACRAEAVAVEAYQNVFACGTREVLPIPRMRPTPGLFFQGEACKARAGIQFGA